MVKNMLAATLALGLAAGGASAQVSDSEAKARGEAEVARAQAERARAEMQKLAAQNEKLNAQLRELARRLEALEKDRNAKSDGEGGRPEAAERARAVLRRAIDAEKAAKAAAPKKEAYIGVVTEKAPELLAEHLGLKEGGLLVVQVSKDSPAEKAGLKPHDVVLSFNSKAVTSPEQFKKLVVGEKGGSKASIVILRHGQKENVGVVLGERDAAQFGKLLERAGSADKLFGGEGDFKVFRRPEGEGADLFRKFAEEAPNRAEGRARARVETRTRSADGGGGKGGDTSVTLNINAQDDKLTISGSVTSDGKTTNFKESGTKEELLKNINKFPEKVRDSVRHSLEASETGPAGKRRIRIQTDGKDGPKGGAAIIEKILDPKALAEIEAAHGDVAKLKDHIKLHVLNDEHLKALKDIKVQVLDAKTGVLKELKDLKPEQLEKLEGLKDLKALKLDKLEALKDLEGLKELEGLKDLEALKDLDVQVRVLAPEKLKDIADLKDKLPGEIKIEVQKALEEAGLKDKIKAKKVIIDRRESQ